MNNPNSLLFLLVQSIDGKIIIVLLSLLATKDNVFNSLPLNNALSILIE